MDRCGQVSLKRKHGLRDVYLTDYDLTPEKMIASEEIFVHQYVSATQNVLPSSDEDVLEDVDMLEDEEEKDKTMISLCPQLRQQFQRSAEHRCEEIDAALHECLGQGHATVDVMEVCCEPDSMLIQEVERQGGVGLRLGLFNGYDLMTREGTQRALEAIRKYRPKVMWISMPCGATSPIQHLNELTADSKKKSLARKKKSRKLVRNGVKLMSEQAWLGGEVVQEWPFPNDAWYQSEIRCFWEALDSVGKSEVIRLDGCAFGLKHEDKFMKKPWMLKCTRPGMIQPLARLCPRNHEHVPTLGKLARRSALYTPQMCRVAARCLLQARSEMAYGAIEVKADYDGLKELTSQELEKLYQSVYKLHKLCGHPSNRALQKTLAARGADPIVVAAAGELRCLECREGQMAAPSSQVSLQKEETLWTTMQMDSFVFKYGDQVHHFLLCLDEASGFSVVQEMLVHHESERENLNASSVIDMIEQCWIQYFGYPAKIRADLEGAFRSTDLHNWCAERGVQLVHSPAEHHESTGDVERAIGELKKKMVAFLRSEESQPKRAAWAMRAAHNHVERVGGYSPAQWAFGRDVPAPENLAAQSSEADSNHAMAKNLEMRLNAENMYKTLQAKAKISRALNSRVQKSTQFIPGDLVYYRRFKQPADNPAHHLLDLPNMKVARWYGPGRVPCV